MMRKLTNLFSKEQSIKFENGEIDINKLRKRAEKYYRDGDFYCSEAVLKVIKDGFDAPYGDDIIKLASGFPVGMGRSGCACGAVTGGVMALSMFFGRDEAKSSKVKKSMELAKELNDKFAEKRKVCCCKILTRGMELGSKEHMEQCIEITGELTEITAEILARELGYKVLPKEKK